MGHEVEVVLQECPSVVVGIIVMVSDIGVATDGLLPPVWHTILIGIPVGSAMLLGPFLPTAIGRIGDVGLVVNFTLDIRLRALVGPSAVERFANVTHVLFVTHGHGDTSIAGHNLHGILGSMDFSIGWEQWLIDQIFIVGRNIAGCRISVASFIIRQCVILVLTDVATDISRIGSVVSYVGR